MSDVGNYIVNIMCSVGWSISHYTPNGNYIKTERQSHDDDSYRTVEFVERIRLRNDDDYFDRVVVVVIKIKAKERHVLTITIQLLIHGVVGVDRSTDKSQRSL